MVVCSTCQQDLPGRGFSQNQRHKDESIRRCKVCVERSQSGNQLINYQNQMAQQNSAAAVAFVPTITAVGTTTTINNAAAVATSSPNAFTSSDVYKAATDPQRSQRQTDYVAAEVQRLEDLESFVQDELNCPICFEEMSLETDCHYRIVVLACSHSLCFHCYARMKKKQHDETAQFFPCPICRRECSTASELPRTFKILLQYALKYSKIAEGNAVSSKQQPQLVQNSKTNNTSKHDHLQNFTTGTICIVNAAQQCGAVRLDDVLPGRDGRHPMTFFFNTSPRFRELQAGMFVKFRIDEQGTADPNRWVAKNVEPFEDHNKPSRNSTNAVHRRNGNDDDSGPSISLQQQRQQQEAERQRQVAERQRQEELQLMEQRENERLRRVHRELAERQQKKQQEEERQRQAQEAESRVRQAQQQRDQAERQRVQQEAERQRQAQIRHAEQQEAERLRRAQAQREQAERQRLQQRQQQLAYEQYERQRQLDERQQEEARRVNEIRRRQEQSEEEHRRQQQWREQEVERQRQEREERRRQQEELARRQTYSSAATTNSNTSNSQGCLIA